MVKGEGGNLKASGVPQNGFGWYGIAFDNGQYPKDFDQN